MIFYPFAIFDLVDFMYEGHYCQRQNCFKCCQNSVDHFSTKLFSSLFFQEKKMGQGHYHLRRICTLHKVS